MNRTTKIKSIRKGKVRLIGEVVQSWLRVGWYTQPRAGGADSKYNQENNFDWKEVMLTK